MKKHFTLYLLFLVALLTTTCHEKTERIIVSPQWQEINIELTSLVEYPNPYTDVDVHAVFTLDSLTITRPAFWDGANTWKLRFSSPVPEGEWSYVTHCTDQTNGGLHRITGKIEAVPYQGNNQLVKKGLLKMSAGHRNIIHAEGHPFIVVGDTPWALPFRGTTESVEIYAADRQEKGFNAALLMSLQPDMKATGPRDRISAGGFDVAFEDLPEGHINKMNISYFQYLDNLVTVLLNHEIVPVYQPVFHGFGWKGLEVLGSVIDPAEYARYCRYLVARYGAAPAIWLVGGDGNGKNPGVEEGGQEIEKWDDYMQPTGIHYNPFDDYCPDFMNESSCFHENRSHHGAEWLDFQWCQTGHDGLHLPHKVYKMYDYLPVKGVANGEPTYEAMGRDPDRAAGWWQGHEAWLQFTSGGTMGHVYGAAGLWQWKLFPDEPGWDAWADGLDLYWKESIELGGSDYVGYFGQILRNYDITDIRRSHELAGGKLLLSVPGRLYICYLPEGGEVRIEGIGNDMPYRWYDPATGEAGREMHTEGGDFDSPGEGPGVLIIGERMGKMEND